ncbi:response regulator [uncultured Pontibacter sp.]|uniref:response regulator n=1 Tax=uncultured Pontibacter sp. TaxID=453356 RepID=UPI0026132188|nr:response regulator [uncultured Pontibacter sp.]
MLKINSILLVDDDKASNFINQLLIKKAAVTDELYIARNGKEAIELIRDKCLGHEADVSKMPQLILLDINMPVMDGFDFLKAFEELDCPSKASALIAVLTTSLNPKDRERVTAAGITHFLTKPLTKQVLEDLLQAHFERRQNQL